MKNFDIKKYKFLVIEITVMVMLSASFFFWLQPFFQLDDLVGTNPYTLNGFDIAFGKVYEVTHMTYPPSTETVVVKPSVLACLSFSAVCVAILLQIAIIVLKITKKGPKNLWHIFNFTASGLTLFAGIMCLLAKYTFNTIDAYIFRTLNNPGSITTGIFIVSTSIVTFLNSVELFQKNDTEVSL